MKKKTSVKLQLKNKKRYVGYKDWSKRKKKFVKHRVEDKLHEHAKVNEANQALFELI